MDHTVKESIGLVVMPQQFTKLNVFISSPSNLGEERATVAKVLESLNPELTNTGSRVELSIFKWEADAVPGIGLDPQAVINSQLNYDIYVGLMGATFGAATTHAGSGTEEEFNRAYGRYTNEPENIRVLFYFKQSLESVFEVDPEQLRKVQQFRASLGPKGVLYHDFRNLDSLGDSLRSHFRSLIRDQWDGTAWKILSPRATSIAITVSDPLVGTSEILESSVYEEKPGLYELTVIATGSAKDLTGHMQRMTTLANQLSFEITAQASNITGLNVAIDGTERAVTYADAIAEEMEKYTTETGSELMIYRNTTASILESLDGIANLYFEEKTGSREDIETIIASFSHLAEVIKSVRTKLQEFKAVLDRVPSITRKVRSSKKHLLSRIDEFISSYTVFVSSAKELIEKIEHQMTENEA